MKNTVPVLGFLIGITCGLDALGDESAQTRQREQLFYRCLGSSALIRGGRIEPHWLPDGQCFWYYNDKPDGGEFYLVDPEANKKERIFDSVRLRAALRAASTGELPAQGYPFRTIRVLGDGGTVRFDFAGKIWQWQRADARLTEAGAAKEKATDKPRLVRSGVLDGEPATREAASPNGRYFATETRHNLGLRTAGTDKVVPLTSDGSGDCFWDVASARWSPNSAKLAVCKVDRREVPRYPVVDWLSLDLRVRRVPLPKPGAPIPQSTLFLLDIASKKMTRVQTGPTKDQYLLPISWTPDAAEYLFARHDRSHKKLELLAANPETGAVRSILTETAKTFVQTPLLSSLDLPFLGGGRQFLWLSERSGWNHLYLYDRRGKLLRQLTEGEFPIVRVIEVDEKRGWVYFTAHGDRARPYETHLYRVPLAGGKMELLTEAEGQHDSLVYMTAAGFPANVGIRFSPSKAFFLDAHSSIDRPPRAEVRRADGKLLQVLETADVGDLKSLSWRAPEPFVVKADDGRTDLHGVLYKPFDFDANKKYPILDYIYNGPQITWVPHSFNEANGLLAQAFAQLGYIVIMVDGRGTPERGKAFQDVVYGRFGQHEIPDHVAALKQLTASRPWMDRERVGIFGGSFGGYMTVRAMLTAPDVYRVGVATGPIYDLQDVSAGVELYMGTPAETPDGYAKASCLKLAGQLKGRLMIVHGSSDVNAPFAGTMRMIDAFVRAGRLVDLQVLPGGRHFLSSGPHQLYYLNALKRYFLEHLPPEKKDR